MIFWGKSGIKIESANREQDNAVFLRKWVFVVERGGRLRPTRGAILVLGADEYVRQVLPRIMVDLQFYYHRKDEYTSSGHGYWCNL